MATVRDLDHGTYCPKVFALFRLVMPGSLDVNSNQIGKGEALANQRFSACDWDR